MSKDPELTEQEALEVEKLRLETQVLKRGFVPWYRRPTRVVGALGALFVFLAALIGFIDKTWDLRTAESDIKHLESDRDLLALQIAALGKQSEDLQQLISSLGSKALSGSSGDGDLETQARSAVHKVYALKKVKLNELTSQLNDMGSHADVLTDGHVDDYRDEIERLSRQIAEMERAYPWVKD